MDDKISLNLQSLRLDDFDVFPLETIVIKVLYLFSLWADLLVSLFATENFGDYRIFLWLPPFKTVWPFKIVRAVKMLLFQYWKRRLFYDFGLEKAHWLLLWISNNIIQHSGLRIFVCDVLNMQQQNEYF